MLGKRFRRTTSMSHLGPGSPAAGATTPPEKTQVVPTPHSVPPKAARPCNNLILQPQSDFEASEGRPDAFYGDVNMASGFGAAAAQIRSACHAKNGVVDHDDVRRQILAVAGWEDDVHCDSVVCYGDAESMQKSAGTCQNSDVVFDDRSAPAAMRSLHAGVVSCFQEQSPGSLLMPYQMGLWINNSTMHGSHGLHGKLEQAISPVGFLDVCFYCKRRLRHERDIFIYRGDTAFCSEECRHRQIVNDERRSSRANNSSSKRSGGARASSSSETAVAA